MTTTQKQSAAKIGSKNPKFKGYYICLGRKYESASLAASKLGINRSTIIRRAKNVLNLDFYFLDIQKL